MSDRAELLRIEAEEVARLGCSSFQKQGWCNDEDHVVETKAAAFAIHVLTYLTYFDTSNGGSA